MSKSIELTPTQIKALESGATMFLFTIDNRILECVGNKMYRVECSGGVSWDCEKTIIKELSPIQKGDKDIFIQEYAYQTDIGKMYYNVRSEAGSYYIPKENGTLIVASQMTKEQSRYSFSECILLELLKCKIGLNI